MSVTKDQVLAALRRVKGPDLEGNIVDLGLVSEILLKDGRAYFSITVPHERAEELEPLRQAAEKVVKEVGGVTGVTAVLTAEAKPGTTRTPPPAGTKPAGPVVRASGGGTAPESARVQAARAKGGAGDGANRPQGNGHGHSHAPQQGGASARGMAQVPGIKHMIAVASGKGGVGKSTTAVNLALGFQAIGLKVGILDADIYGPSQPRLLGIDGRPETTPGNKLKPMSAYGLQAMSMGFLIDEGTPIIWRGPMVVSALNQMLREVAWGNVEGQDLDVLVIDMPPGTGDIQLSMAQQVPLSGAIIVSTPQDLALIDARKGLNMFRKVDVPVLGIVENMSFFICTKCGERHEIFGHGGAEAEAGKLGLPFLGGVPLHLEIRERSDSGQPITATKPESIHAQIYRDIAAKAWSELQSSIGKQVTPPRLEIAGNGAELLVAFDAEPAYNLPAEMLRVMSPSAEVQGHSPDQRVTVARKRSVKIKSLTPIGNYAVKIAFDDGHDTGLFTWNYLETLHRERDKRWSGYLRELEERGLSRG